MISTVVAAGGGDRLDRREAVWLAGARGGEVALPVGHDGGAVQRRAVGELEVRLQRDRPRLAAGRRRGGVGQVGNQLSALGDLEELAEDRVHLILVGGAVDIGRRIQAGGPCAGVPPSSSTVSDPPGFGVPVAADDRVDVERRRPDADDAEELVLELEPPHALTAAAIRNRQAAIAASLLQRMASLILGLSSSCSLHAGAPRAVHFPVLSWARRRRC